MDRIMEIQNVSFDLDNIKEIEVHPFAVSIRLLRGKEYVRCAYSEEEFEIVAPEIMIRFNEKASVEKCKTEIVKRWEEYLAHQKKIS